VCAPHGHRPQPTQRYLAGADHLHIRPQWILNDSQAIAAFDLNRMQFGIAHGTRRRQGRA
jgi:hypothetical protein